MKVYCWFPLLTSFEAVFYDPESKLIFVRADRTFVKTIIPDFEFKDGEETLLPIDVKWVAINPKGFYRGDHKKKYESIANLHKFFSNKLPNRHVEIGKDVPKLEDIEVL